jgi:hypothetical protein
MKNARKNSLFGTRVTPALVIASISALWLAPAASAQSVIMTGSTNNITVSPGDTIEAGYQVSVPKSHHPVETVSPTTAVVRVPVNCPNGSSQTITINLSSQSVTVPADSIAWSPGGKVYQGQTKAPSTLCGGKQGSTKGATFMATFGHACHARNHESEEDCCHQHHFRFHIHRHHKGNGGNDHDGDQEGEFNDEHGEQENERECESPEKANHPVCCKQKD